MIDFSFLPLLMALAEFGILKTKKQRAVIDLIIKQMTDSFSLLNFITQVLCMVPKFILSEVMNTFILLLYVSIRK
jgi:hypothetical protein